MRFVGDQEDLKQNSVEIVTIDLNGVRRLAEIDDKRSGIAELWFRWGGGGSDEPFLAPDQFLSSSKADEFSAAAKIGARRGRPVKKPVNGGTDGPVDAGR